MPAFQPTPDRHIACLENVTMTQFGGIMRQGHPMVLKGVAADWPLVRQARQSDQAAAGYLKALDTGKPVPVWIGEPEIRGEFFYGDTPGKLNFRKAPASISTTLDHLLTLVKEDNPRSVYIQSLPVADHLPGLLDTHRLDLLPDIPPRIWIGNRLRVQTHYDPVDNVAVLAAGRRRFTLFAPDQTPNLYVGPLEKTVAGAPVSMAAIEQPDFVRFPRLREALDNAWYADLEPGDGIYIPYMWWHHVQSLTPFNILVNYWWDAEPAHNIDGMDAFIHAVLTLKRLPENKRAIWKTMFDHYVFEMTGDPVAHLAEADKGALGDLTDAEVDMRRRLLLDRLASKWKD
jgi:hypothetical protein